MKTKLYIILSFIISSLAINAQNSWILQSSGVTVSLDCIKVVDQNIVWAAGDSGNVVRTVNGGMNWNSVDGGNFGSAIIWNIDAIDSNTAFITTTPPPFTATHIYKTSNGGSTWGEVFSQDGGFINDIHMINDLNGIAYGDPVNGKWTILKTYDGGNTWLRISTEPVPGNSEIGIYYNSLFLTDSLHIWFIGSQNVYRSINGGITWTSTPTFPSFTSLWFNNDSIGMASTAINAVLSVDSGITWSYLTPGFTSTYSMAGSGIKDYWFASDGSVFHTTDYGASWTYEFIMSGQFIAIDFVTIGDMAYGFVAGTGGSIANYSGTITSVTQDYQNPTKLVLEQNYPNPFNPNTTINYSITKSGLVQLKVYNILGKEVSVLVNEEKPQGQYSVKFDGSNLPSGVYMYSLRVNNFSEKRKMILLK